MVDIIWAIAPPLTLLIYYYKRVSGRFFLNQTYGFFCMGIFSGIVALNLGWKVETTFISWGNWQAFTLTFIGVVIRQFLVVAPLEELSKFVVFIIALLLYYYLFYKYSVSFQTKTINKKLVELFFRTHKLLYLTIFDQAQKSRKFSIHRQINQLIHKIINKLIKKTALIKKPANINFVKNIASHCQHPPLITPTQIFIYAIAFCLGFTTHENWVFLSHGNGTPFERMISTPVHAMFAIPWIYVIAITAAIATVPCSLFDHKYQLIWVGFNCIFCHAVVNIFANAGAFNLPIRYLSYGLFPFLLYLFWRMERKLQQIEGKKIKYLLKNHSPSHVLWRFGLVLFVIILGGNSLLGIFISIRAILPLPIEIIWEYSTLSLLIGRILFNLVFGCIAAGIYFYLKSTARSSY